MGELNVYNQNGEVVSTVAIDSGFIESELKHQTVHDVVVAYLANQRTGTANTKTRNEVNASTIKPWRQKGTGRARSGMRSSPVWRGGGTIFGPKPRDYRQDISRNEKKAALKSAFTSKLNDNVVKIVDAFTISEPKTKTAVEMFKKLDVPTQKLLIITASINNNLIKSVRNIQGVNVVTGNDVNTFEMLNTNNIVIENGAIDILKQRLLS